MKILILANNDVGLYKFRKELINELIYPGSYIEDRNAKPCQVFISIPNGEFVQELEKIGCKFIDTPIDRRGMNPINDLKLLNHYKKIVSQIKPDIVLTYTIKPNIYGGFICRFKKIPYAVNITGVGTAFQKEGLLKKIVIFMYKIALKDAKVVYFENIANMTLFIEEKIMKKEKCCLLNGAGVNLEDYKFQEYPSDNSEIHFLFIGRVMKEKGIDELFSTMKKLYKENKNCYLDVVGNFEENYFEKINQGEKEGWLKYHGYQNDVRPFIKQAHCFVLPSWHEGMANTNLESAALGRPVITSNIHGCKEAVIENVTGFLCEPKNAESLYKVMKKFINLSQEERVNMGLIGRKHMENVFDKKKVVEKTIVKLI